MYYGIAGTFSPIFPGGPMALSNLRYRHGLRDGFPIGLAYLSVSFGFGVSAAAKGIGALCAVIISATNLTSAGQVAGTDVIAAGGSIARMTVEMALCQFIINLRYCLMGLTLTQKLDERFSVPQRMLTSFFITDEIFAVASSKGSLISPAYMYGIGSLPWVGWTLGTLLGSLAGELLPASVSAALGIAIYGMFVAIIVPAAKKNKGVLFTAALAAALSCAFRYIPLLSRISSGFAVIICAVPASAAAALLFPVKEDESRDS